MAANAKAQAVYVPPLAPTAAQQVVNSTNGPRGPVQFLTSGNGATITLPVTLSGTAGYSRQSGFQLSVDASWPGQYGYRPVVFTLKSRKPLVADQRITIEFTAGDWAPPRGKAINVTQSFTFPAGAATASETVIVPRLQDWQLATWRVKVDGRSDDFLAIDQLYFSGIGVGQAGLGVMGLGLTPQQQTESTIVLQASSSGLGVNLTMMDGKELPTNWVEYSSLDVFVIPAERLVKLAADRPKQFDALLRWVRAGGNLWLVEAGSWHRLAAVERLVAGLSEAGGQQDEGAGVTDPGYSSKAAVLSRGWRYAPIGDRSAEPAEGALLLSAFDTGAGKTWQDLYAAVTGDATSQQRFLVRGYGLGAITAFRVDWTITSSNDGTEYSAQINQSLLGPRITWSSRHGNQPDVANAEFNNLLIPNVGVAPVGQFQVLITLFILAIGPLNYWLLKRKNKLPLLLATVPAAALATTFVLFAYGLVVDGFGVLARSRTLTLLDQRAGEAVSWGRLSYYAGIAPRNGLTAPADQVMYPIMPRWSASRYGGRAVAAPRYLTWNKDQNLRRGWLASRTPTQYQAIVSRPSLKKLELRATKRGLRVVNRLGVNVTHLAVEDHEGRFYWCENLADGAGLVVPATDRDQLTGGIRQLFTENLPEAPGGDEVGYNSYPGQANSQGLMEARFEAINSPMVQSWGPGKYVAFTKQAVELDLGLDDLKEEASFHVIEGTW